MENFITVISLSIGLIGVISSILSTRWNGKKYKIEAKKQREAQDLTNRENLIEEIREGLETDIISAVQEICNENSKKFITRAESEQSDHEIKQLLRQLRQDLTNYHDKIDKSEGKHIAYIITAFAEDLKKGETKTQTSYRAVLEYFDYYKNILNMNSFIEKEMEYIVSKMKEEK